jgi:hypothetical protein
MGVRPTTLAPRASTRHTTYWPAGYVAADRPERVAGHDRAQVRDAPAASAAPPGSGAGFTEMRSYL